MMNGVYDGSVIGSQTLCNGIGLKPIGTPCNGDPGDPVHVFLHLNMVYDLYVIGVYKVRPPSCKLVCKAMNTLRQPSSVRQLGHTMIHGTSLTIPDPVESLLRKCIAGTKIPVDLERATSRIWSYALQAERKAVMYEVMLERLGCWAAGGALHPLDSSCLYSLAIVPELDEGRGHCVELPEICLDMFGWSNRTGFLPIFLDYQQFYHGAKIYDGASQKPAIPPETSLTAENNRSV